MRPSFDAIGSQVQAQRDYQIASGTVVAQDQIVKLTGGKVVLAVAGETSPILGTAAESHSGVADTLNAKSNGLTIRVNDSPTQVFEYAAPQVTATGGTTTTFVASAVAGFADSDFVGGFLKLISKGGASTNVDSIGTVYPITGSTAATGTFTIAAIAGAFSVGDVCAVFPPVGFQKGNLDAGISKLVLTASAALPIRVSGSDLSRNMIFAEASLHEHGNKKA
jgi:hypothetical protein